MGIITARLNAGEFDNLVASWYWSSTEDALSPDGAWYFNINYDDNKNGNYYRLAPRSEQISVGPVLAAILFLGSGLPAFAGSRIRRKKKS